MQRVSTNYTFGRFHLDTVERRLLRDGQPVPLTPKAFETLLTLVKHAGHAVSKDDLMRAVWPDGFVEESNLAFNISTLRKALGKGHAGERYIETVPKHGYRFVMPVKVIEASSSPFSASHAKRSNLPAQLTRFIGRAQEIAEVTALVQTRRLVTLTGAGGVGKSRLTLEAGGRLLDQFIDGAWLAELAPLGDESLVPATVAGVFNLQEQPGRSSLDMLISYIGEKRMLLIFDNCEHVIDASAKLAEALLQACPNLHILATSREALRVAGEAVWRVPSMEVPAAQDVLSPQTALDFDSVQLFLEHASLVQPDFALTQDNLETVLIICRRLDGIPLAIEMAAAQLDVLDLKQIATGLETSFDGLAHGSRRAVPRHQTLRATLDWSYNLLSEPERALLARLSVFRGGFTAESAQKVCGSSSQTLLQLFRKSIVTVYMDNSSNQSRYRLLEIVRQYAEKMLHQRGETNSLKKRHFAYFLTMSEEPIDLAGPFIDAWLKRMQSEYDNLRAAFAYTLTCNDEGENAMRMVYAMTTFWFNCGPATDFEYCVNMSLSKGRPASLSTQARGLMAQFGCLIYSGELARAMKLGEAALALFRQTDDLLGLAWCLENLANNMHNTQAQALAEEALPLFRKLGSRDGEGRILRALGTSAYWSGDRTLSAQLLEQSIEIAPWDMEECMWYLYTINPKRALQICALHTQRFIDGAWDGGNATPIRIYAALLVAEGNYEDAKLKCELFMHYTRFGNVPAFYSFGVFEMLTLGTIECGLHHTNQAIAWFDNAMQLADENGFHIVSFTARFLKAVMLDSILSLVSTMDIMLECLQGFHKIDFKPGLVCVLTYLAHLQGRQVRSERAGRLMGSAMAYSSEVDRWAIWMNGVLWVWYRDAQHTIIAPALAAAREALGDEAFEAAYSAGQRMSLDEAVALALSRDAMETK